MPSRNAMCESFLATLECELLDWRRFRSHAEARMAAFTFIEGWYNPNRRHSGLGYLSPINYETRSMTEPKIPTPNRPQNRGNSSSANRVNAGTYARPAQRSRFVRKLTSRRPGQGHSWRAAGW